MKVKRLLMALLAIVLTTSSALAEVKTGKCGTNVTYTLDTGTGLLRISGNGEMSAYSYDEWTPYKWAIKEVQIDYGVTTIGNYAFRNLPYLVQVSIPESVTSIGWYAFSGCTNLPSISLPEGLINIKEGAFEQCTALMSFTAPNTVTSIGEGILKDCSSLRYISLPFAGAGTKTHFGAIFSTSYNSKMVAISQNGISYYMPSTLDSLSIRGGSITGYALANLKIKFLELGNGVTSIARDAMSGCSNLESIVLPFFSTTLTQLFTKTTTALKKIVITGGESIPAYAFSNWANLEEVYLPSSVTSIGGGAFSGCTLLKKLTIPPYVKSIGSGAVPSKSFVLNFSELTVSGATNIRNIVTKDGNFLFYTIDGANYLYGCDVQDETIVLPTSYKSGTYAIGPYAFRGNKNVRSVEMGKNCTLVQSLAFEGTNLMSLTVSERVDEIESCSFTQVPVKTIWLGNKIPLGYKNASGMANYASVTYPDMRGAKEYKLLSSMFEVDGVKYVIVNSGDRTCDAIDCIYGVHNTIHVGEDVTYKTLKFKALNVLPYTFCGQTKAENATIQNAGIVGDKAFEGCSSLSKVEIGNSVVSFGNSVFAGAVSLKDVNIEEGDSLLLLGHNNRKPFFCDCPLNSVTIGRPISFLSDEFYGYSPFCGNKSLNTVKFLDCENDITAHEFQNCTRLESISISRKASTVGDYAFQNCSALSQISIPDAIKSIGNNAFQNCTGLQTATLGMGLEKIGGSAFMSCSSLKSITLPSGVKSAGDSAFEGCAKLISATLSNSMTGVNNRLFYGCKSLQSMSLPNSITSVGSSSFEGCESMATISLGNSLTNIMDAALKDCRSLSKVDFPISLANIANKAFTGCTRLAIVNFKNTDSELAIGVDGTNGLFYTCGLDSAYVGRPIKYTSSPFHKHNSLAKVRMASEAKEVRDAMFYACTNLRNVYVESTGNIGGSAFYDCTSLKQIDLRNVAGTIGDSAFMNCKALSKLNLGAKVTGIEASAFRNCTGLGEVDIPQSNKYVGGWGFANCSSLKKVNVDSGTETIGEYAFSECISLPYMSIPKTTNSIGAYSFGGCSTLSVVSLENGENTLNIASTLFDGCPLDSVFIGRKIKYGEKSPFYEHPTLRSVRISDIEDQVYKEEFMRCYNLQWFKMGDGVRTIGKWAFNGCSGLETFSFGTGLQSIGTEAFSDCTGMTSLTSHAVVPPVCGDQTLEDINVIICTLYVPEQSIDAYKAADQWSSFFFIEPVQDNDEEDEGGNEYFAKGFGTEEKPYLITTVEELRNIDKMTNVYYRVENDIDLTEWIRNNSSEEGWLPISRLEDCHLDGNGKTISGYWMNSTQTNAAFLVSVKKSVIDNLHIQGTDVVSKGIALGGLALTIENSEVKQCSVSFTSFIHNGGIKAGVGHGGIVAAILEGGSVINCSSSIGTVSVNNKFGGIAGIAKKGNATISNCSFKGNIAKGHDCIAGILGDANDARIEGCTFEGEILPEYSTYSDTFIGGIVGFGTIVEIRGCNVHGTISYPYTYTRPKRHSVGGIVGACMGNSSIVNCCISGSVSADYYVGGIAGEIHGGTVEAKVKDNYFIGTVSGKNYVGGLVGYSDLANIENSYSCASVLGTGDYVGGLVGCIIDISTLNSRPYIKSCVALNAEVSGNGDNVGRIYGNNDKLTECDFISNLSLDLTSCPSDDTQNAKTITLQQAMSRSIYESIGWDFKSTWNIKNGESFPYQEALSDAVLPTDDIVTRIKSAMSERVEPSAIYDLQGRKVSKPTTGLFIQNGRKVVIK